MMQKNTITVTSDKITQPFNFAFAADFHDGNVDEALALMQGSITRTGRAKSKHR